MTAQEFAEGYASRSGVGLAWLMTCQQVSVCDCGDEICNGWQMISRDCATYPNGDPIPEVAIAVGGSPEGSAE